MYEFLTFSHHHVVLSLRRQIISHFSGLGHLKEGLTPPGGGFGLVGVATNGKHRILRVIHIHVVLHNPLRYFYRRMGVEKNISTEAEQAYVCDKRSLKRLNFSWLEISYLNFIEPLQVRIL